MMALPLVSIIVPTYNRSEMLRAAIKSLLRQETGGKFSYEIYIVDDASTDETSSVISELMKHPRNVVRYVQGEGKGYSHALNTGLAVSRSEWLAFFDDDEVAEPGWLKELFLFAEGIGGDCVSGNLILDTSEAVLSGLGPVCKALVGVRSLEGVVTKCHAKLHPAGGHMLIKRSVFDGVGVFDEKMLTGGCDRDLILRALDAGFVMGLTPKAVVRHVIPSHRFTAEHIRWYSLQFGNSFAYIDWKRLGSLKTSLACIARIGQALLVNFPLLLVGRIRGDHAEIMDRKALLWRALGYTSKTLSLLAPGISLFDRFFARLEFRKERESFPKYSNNTTKL